MPLSRPEPLNNAHELNDFVRGIASLVDWLKKRARPNQVSGASRTFVVADNHKAVGYYALESGAITVEASVGHFRRNMPDPIALRSMRYTASGWNVSCCSAQTWRGRWLEPG